MWKFLKEAIDGKSVKCNINSMKFDDRTITDELLIATNYNNYIVKSITELIPCPNNNYQIDDMKSEILFKFKEINCSNVEREIKHPGNGTSSDFLDKKLIEKGGSKIIEQLVDIFNSSMHTGEFPEMWKTSVIIPVRKIPYAKSANEFRPVNTLPFAEKLFERIVKKQLLQHLINYNIIIDNQSAFRQSHSCETAL